MKWQLQEAKQRFSEIVRQAQADGPQVVSRHGRAVVVVVDVDEYERLTGSRRDFKQFLQAAPDLDALDIVRPATPPATSTWRRRVTYLARHQRRLGDAQAPPPTLGSGLVRGRRRDLYLSVLVVGEIVQGVERLRRRDPPAAVAHDPWLDELRRLRRPHPAGRPGGGRGVGRHQRARSAPVVDGLLAATAKVRGWTLVTRNARDVARTGVRVLDPFALP